MTKGFNAVYWPGGIVNCEKGFFGRRSNLSRGVRCYHLTLIRSF